MVWLFVAYLCSSGVFLGCSRVLDITNFVDVSDAAAPASVAVVVSEFADLKASASINPRLLTIVVK